MPTITLHNLTRNDLIALEQVPMDWCASYGYHADGLPEILASVATPTLKLMGDATDSRWYGYLAIDANCIIGTCAFKGAPDVNGVVEIAYFTFPPFERMGYGFAMATQLVEIARTSSDVKLIIAHTSPEKNASTRILEKLGMRWIGEVIDDPADGPVWRWEMAKA